MDCLVIEMNSPLINQSVTNGMIPNVLSTLQVGELSLFCLHLGSFAYLNILLHPDNLINNVTSR